MFDFTPFDLVSLNEIVAKKEVRDPRKTPDWMFYYIDIASVSNKTFKILGSKQYIGADAPSRARKVIRENDVIFATTRPYLKSIARVPAKLDGYICSTGFCVLRPTERVLPDWLFYCAISDDLLRQVTPKMRGANYPAVTDKDVLEAMVPLPSLDEQHRIVARIKECIERVEEIKALRQDALREAERFYPCRCHEIFTDQNTDEWTETTISKISDTIQYGYTQSASKEKVGPHFLRITDIQDQAVNWASVPYCEIDRSIFEKYHLVDGDILFARTGATTGKSFLITGDPPDSVFASYLIRLKVNREKVIPRLVYHFFQSPSYWDQVYRNKRGGAQPNINSKVLGLMSLRVPSTLNKQEALIAQLDEVFEFAQRLKVDLRHQTEQITYLRESILRKAFAREL